MHDATLRIPPQAPRRVSIDWLGIVLLISSAGCDYADTTAAKDGRTVEITVGTPIAERPKRSVKVIE